MTAATTPLLKCARSSAMVDTRIRSRAASMPASHSGSSVPDLQSLPTLPLKAPHCVAPVASICARTTKKSGSAATSWTLSRAKSISKRVRAHYIGETNVVTRRQVLCVAAASTALASMAGMVRAQAYPARPVRILVGFVAGGNFDIVARLMGEWLSEQLRQPVIVENRPGASSNLATEAVIRAPADGYRLLLGGAVNAVNATLYENLNFNFIDDTTPVAGVVGFPNVMTVAASFPAKTVPEFIAYA